jgi:uncharacterized protein (DUF697 family)
MHHIIGGFIVGAAFGQTTRQTIWRPLLRNVIKGGIVAAREARAVTAAVRAEAVSIYEEAQSELNRLEAHPSPSTEPEARPRSRKPAKRED